MKKNGAIWVALVVVAVAALFFLFLVLPQKSSGKAVDKKAKNAGETVEQATRRRTPSSRRVPIRKPQFFRKWPG